MLLEIVLENFAVFKTKEQAVEGATSMTFKNLEPFKRFKARNDHKLFRLQTWGGCKPCAKINADLKPL